MKTVIITIIIPQLFTLFEQNVQDINKLLFYYKNCSFYNKMSRFNNKMRPQSRANKTLFFNAFSTINDGNKIQYMGLL